MKRRRSSTLEETASAPWAHVRPPRAGIRFKVATPILQVDGRVAGRSFTKGLGLLCSHAGLAYERLVWSVRLPHLASRALARLRMSLVPRTSS